MKPIHSSLPESVFDAETLLVVARAVRKALARHNANGDTVVVWRDGRVVTLLPEEIEL